MSVGKITIAEKNQRTTKQEKYHTYFRDCYGWRVFADAIDIPGQNKSKSASKLSKGRTPPTSWKGPLECLLTNNLTGLKHVLYA